MLFLWLLADTKDIFIPGLKTFGTVSNIFVLFLNSNTKYMYVYDFCLNIKQTFL